jgi:glutaredoxin
MENNKKAIVWSKDYCPYCDQAKNLLKIKGIEYEERNVTGGEWTKEQLLEAVPGARTVPQVFIDGKLIGTYEHLKKYFDTQE